MHYAIFFSNLFSAQVKKAQKYKKKYNKRQAAQVLYMKLSYQRDLCAIS